MYKKFIMAFLSFALFLFAAASAFNILIDPYGVWHLYRARGINLFAYKEENVERLTKPLEYVDHLPETVFLGTSQIDWSFDPVAFEQRTGREAYNFGITALPIYEVRRALEHSLATNPNLTQVIMNINFEQFMYNERHKLPTEKTDLGIEQFGHRHMIMDSFKKTTLSFQALEDSLNTLKQNMEHDYDHEFYKHAGQWHENSVKQYFRRNEWGFVGGLHFLARDNRYFSEDSKISEDSLEELRRIVELCKENNLDLKVCIFPQHARFLELLSHDEVCHVYEDWRRSLVQIVPVWDFTAYNEMTMSGFKDGLAGEDINEFFLDSQHPRAVIAEMMLGRMFGSPDSDPDFGTLLTPDNVEGFLQQLRQQRKLWEQAHPESLEEIRYCSGFSAVQPRELAGRQIVGFSGELALSEESRQGQRRFNAEETLELHLELSGPQEGMVYAALLDEMGNKFYAWAEKERSGDKYLVKEPLWGVPAGKYVLCLLGRNTDGTIWQSEPLMQLDIRD